MRILFCCQFYAPSIGGVQEVIRQIAERLVERGHELTVATTRLPMREFNLLNGVAIQEFDVAGNIVSGMTGEVSAYQKYVSEGDFDVVMIYAAQQWTFDALWSVLDSCSSAKVFVPCGFSGLYEPGYAEYFQKLPSILHKFDHLIFNATKYRDIDYAKEHGIQKFSVFPNGASELEFNSTCDSTFRSRHAIPKDSFLYLTVGSFTGLKGHLELVTAFAKMELGEGQHATLILNGNEVQRLERNVVGILNKIRGLVKTHGLFNALRQILNKVNGASSSPKSIAESINRSQSNKRVLVSDFGRAELTQAFMTADLFVFASNIEYCPLVLFETAAAGTPFLSVSVGNSVEIAQWTGAGLICPSTVDAKGYTLVDTSILAQEMAGLIPQKEMLAKLGATGRENWRNHFTWDKVTDRFEQLFLRLKDEKA
ncbi:glycosyltransferase family 4 protein [Herminiimonas sp. NPDC097707]|uniref:glycosyltransferase family 4 protein n=1 Tax=Herminiimonas sp. NPDC097707 TaxID=3364007 RepID=UPI00383AEFCB